MTETTADVREIIRLSSTFSDLFLASTALPSKYEHDG